MSVNHAAIGVIETTTFPSTANTTATSAGIAVACRSAQILRVVLWRGQSRCAIVGSPRRRHRCTSRGQRSGGRTLPLGLVRGTGTKRARDRPGRGSTVLNRLDDAKARAALLSPSLSFFSSFFYGLETENRKVSRSGEPQLRRDGSEMVVSDTMRDGAWLIGCRRGWE